jgi:hypothetical protein
LHYLNCTVCTCFCTVSALHCLHLSLHCFPGRVFVFVLLLPQHTALLCFQTQTIPDSRFLHCLLLLYTDLLCSVSLCSQTALFCSVSTLLYTALTLFPDQHYSRLFVLHCNS